jgi:hypothetical protein
MWPLLRVATTVDSPQFGEASIGQVLKVRGFCGDGRAVIQPNSLSEAEQFLKVTDLAGNGGCPM